MDYKFGPFTLAMGPRQLLRGDEELGMTPKMFEVLVLLLERYPNAVSKEELLETVWPTTYVCEANLTTTVTPLRRTLGVAPGGKEYIRTVRKVGYAFGVHVDKIDTDDGPPRTRPYTVPSTKFVLVIGTEQYKLRMGETLIGRASGCNVLLPSLAVSGRHAKIYVERDRVSIEDQKSTNHTYVNGVRKDTRVVLHHGDRIMLGDVELTLRVPAKFQKERTVTLPVQRGQEGRQTS